MFLNHKKNFSRNLVLLFFERDSSGQQSNMEIGESDKVTSAISPAGFDAMSPMSPGSFLHEVEKLSRPVATITPQVEFKRNHVSV